MNQPRSVFSARRQRGQMSIEFAVVIALIAVVLAGIVYYITVGRTSSKVNDAVTGVSSMLSKAQSLYTSDPSGYTNVSAVSLIDNGAVPAKMVQGTTITSPLGGTVDVAAADVYGGGVGSGVSFTLNNVPAAACADFVNGIASSFVNVKVGSVDVRVDGNNVASYVQALGSACKTGPVAVVLSAGR